LGFDSFADWAESRGMRPEWARQAARVGQQVSELPGSVRGRVAAMGWTRVRAALPWIRRAVREGMALETAVEHAADLSRGTVRAFEAALRPSAAQAAATVRVTVVVPTADEDEFRELLDLATAYCRREDGTVTTGSAVLAALREFSVEVHAAMAVAG
jgi:hypothetical protein